MPIGSGWNIETATASQRRRQVAIGRYDQIVEQQRRIADHGQATAHDDRRDRQQLRDRPTPVCAEVARPGNNANTTDSA
jgi:hypothetical protein